MHSTNLPAAPEVDVDQLARVLEDDATLIDVREPAEYVAGHVPGAALMPMSQLPSRLGELDKTAPVYLICASGNRSAAMTDFLNQAGFDAYSIVGGTAAWGRAGRPLES
jgi:rhodanese-related sulfurtransferase